MPRSKSWVNIELRPAEAPSVTREEPTDGPVYYDVWWERFGLSVMLTGDELQELIGRAMVAQTDRAAAVA